MSRSLHERASEILFRVVSVPAEKRPELLRELCAGDETLRAEVESLLAHYGTEAFASDDAAVPLPERIGDYRIVGVLGVGGMGTVYEAEQENPRRSVALKVVTGLFSTPEARKRFAFEAEVLGRLEHPGIARIYEAGIADEGAGPQQYFAMELIRGGRRLDEAVRELGLREKLELFVEVVDAAHHAHIKSVVHRDLKPANVLVDDAGRPKILDFGIARVLDPDQRRAGAPTLDGRVLGTLPYMSPEQAAGSLEDVDVRSDVFSLGVMLYEALSGRMPYVVPENPVEAAAVIRGTAPEPLGKTHVELRGDVAAIVGKALEKDRERRYQSARELSADIGRYLAQEPILARPPSTIYQLNKFARRHKGLVASVAAVVLALLLGLGGTLWKAREATVQAALADQQRLLADEQAALVTRVNDFYREVFASVDPHDSGPDVRLVTVLDDMAAKIDVRFPDHPVAEADVRDTVGRTYDALGLDFRAEPHLRRALEIRLREMGVEDVAVARSRIALGSVLLDLDRADEALALCTEAERGFHAALGTFARETLLARHDALACIARLGRREEARDGFDVLLELQVEHHGRNHADTLATRQSLADLEAQLGRPEEALRQNVQVVEVLSSRVSDDSVERLSSLNSLGYSYNASGDFAKAAEVWTECLEGRRKTLGERHAHTLNTQKNLASCLFRLGRRSDAREMLFAALEVLEAEVGKGHALTLDAENMRASFLMQTGSWDRARTQYEDILERGEALLPDEQVAVAHYRANYARCLAEKDELDEAEWHLRASLDVLGPEHPTIRQYMEDLASRYESHGILERAAELRALVD